MKKSEFNAVAMALIRKITTLEGHCAHSEEVNKAIDIAELRRIKKSLEERYLSEISALPDDATSKTIASALNTFKAVILKADHIVNTLLDPSNAEGKLKLLEKLYKERIALIVAAIAQSPTVDTFEEHYVKAPDFEDVLLTFITRKNLLRDVLSSITSELSTTTDPEKTYHDSLDRLDIEFKRFNSALQLVNTKYAQFLPIEAIYNQVAELKKAFLRKASPISSLPDKSIIIIAKHDKVTAEKIRLLQKGFNNLNELVGNSAIEFLSKPGSTFEQMEPVAKACLHGLGVYDSLLRALEDPLQTITSKLKTKIAKQKEDYEYFAGFLERILAAEHPAKKPIDTIKTKFAEASKAKPEDEDHFSFLDKKWKDTSAIVEETKTVIRTYTPQINATLIKKNHDLAQSTIERCKTTLDILDSPDFTFDEGEIEPSKSTLEAIKESCLEYLGSRHTPNFEELRDKHEQLVNDLLQIQGPLAQLEKVIATHNLIKEILHEGINIEKLAARLNTTPDGARLSILFERYWNYEQATKLLEKLSANLHLFVSDGRKQVKEFIKNRGNGPAVLAIKKKLTFIDLLSNLGIQHNSFLEAPYVVDAALLLKELNLTQHITYDTLRNEIFCRTLLVLKKRGMEITSEIINSLSHDSNKCEVICQLEEDIRIRPTFANVDDYNSFVFTLEEFKALINYFLNSDKDTAKALHQIQSSQVIYCKPWLVCLVNNTPELKAILCAKDFDINWPFLLPLFDRFLDSSESLSTHTKLQVVHGIGKENFDNYIEKYREHLVAIQAAQSMTFNKRARLKLIMEGFNDFYKEYKEKNKLSTKDREALENFRLAMIPVLLTSSNLHQSKTNLEALAKEYFKSKYHNLHILFDVLQFITLTFIIIMPIQYALNRNVLFSHDTTALCSAVIGKVTDAFGLNPAKPDSWFGRLASRVRG